MDEPRRRSYLEMSNDFAAAERFRREQIAADAAVRVKMAAIGLDAARDELEAAVRAAGYEASARVLGVTRQTLHRKYPPAWKS